MLRLPAEVGVHEHPSHHRPMNGVMGSVEGNGIKVPQERRCFWGATSFRVVVILWSISFLGMEHSGDGSPAFEETAPRYHAYGTSLVSCRYLQGLGGQDRP